MTRTATSHGPVRINDADALRARLRGSVLEPGDPAWDATRQVFNTRLDPRPALIAVPENVQDVQAVVAFANERDLQIVPQRTGHNAEPLGSIEGTILLRTDRMRSVQIDGVAKRALVGAGAKWEDVVPAASALGLAALHGSTPDVSIAGYAMGGGVGWYGRKLGLAADSVTGFGIVTADGRSRWVSAGQEPELFWALRGGGGNFGVVTSLELRLFDMPQLYAGALFFPWERSAEVLHVWHEWTKTVPDETTSVGRILRLPDLPAVPSAIAGRSFAMVEAFHIGDAQEGAELMRPLRELGPEIDTFAMIAPAGLSEIHMDPTEPLPYLTDHAVLAELSPEAIDELVAAVGPGSGSTLSSVELRHLGGALGRPSENPGALAHLPGGYLVFGVGMTPTEAAERAVRGRLDAMLAAIDDHRSGLYFNFTEGQTDPARMFPEATYRRLQAVKRAVDPRGRFRANHAITPGAEVIALERTAHVVSNTLTVAVDAPLKATRRAQRLTPLAGPAVRALRELGLDDRVELRPDGLSWRHPGTNGSVEVNVQIDTDDNGEGGTWLTITTRFSATHDDARVRLLDAWALVGPLASSLAERAARTVKERAERDEFDAIGRPALAA